MRSIRMFGDHVAPPSGERENPTRVPGQLGVSHSFQPTKSRPWPSTATNGSTWCGNGVVPSVMRTFGPKPEGADGGGVAAAEEPATDNVAVTRQTQTTTLPHPRMGTPPRNGKGQG